MTEQVLLRGDTDCAGLHQPMPPVHPAMSGRVAIAGVRQSAFPPARSLDRCPKWRPPPFDCYPPSLFVNTKKAKYSETRLIVRDKATPVEQIPRNSRSVAGSELTGAWIFRQVASILVQTAITKTINTIKNKPISIFTSQMRGANARSTNAHICARKHSFGI